MNYEKNLGIDIFLIQLRRNQYFLIYESSYKKCLGEE